MEVQEIGSTQAVLSGISTKIDGSVSIKLDILPDNQQLISNLMSVWASSDRSFEVAFVRVL